MDFRDSIISAVSNGDFLVVCNGMTEETVPGINVDNIPGFNTEPRPPHVTAQYEVGKSFRNHSQ